MTWFTVLLTAAVIAGGVLTYVGVETVRTSRDGKNVATVTDPSEPGFEAFLEPTPTLLVVHGADSTLVSASLLTLNSGDVGGSILLIPPATRVGGEDDGFALGAVSAFAGSLEAIAPGVQSLLGVGITEVAVVDDARWAELVAPVAPITIENPDAVGEFPAGPLTLVADQVGAYLSARGDGESDMARLYRQQLFYEAWAAAVASSADPAAVPGELESGIGRFVRGLASGPRRVATLPVVETQTAGGTRTEVDPDAVGDLVSELVPFPTASRPGGRVRVRLLDGTGNPDHVMTTAPLVVPADSEIVVVGNADGFDYSSTEIRYHHPTFEPAAEALREALGAGKIVDDPRQTDAFDVTIVLGTDV
jgi:hypothetical protein